jgi:hypothetical protein
LSWDDINFSEKDFRWGDLFHFNIITFFEPHFFDQFNGYGDCIDIAEFDDPA